MKVVLMICGCWCRRWRWISISGRGSTWLKNASCPCERGGYSRGIIKPWQWKVSKSLPMVLRHIRPVFLGLFDVWFLSFSGLFCVSWFYEFGLFVAYIWYIYDAWDILLMLILYSNSYWWFQILYLSRQHCISILQTKLITFIQIQILQYYRWLLSA